MFFKKLLTLVIALAMIFSMCSCAAGTKNVVTPVEANAAGSEAQTDGPSEGDYAEPATIVIFAPQTSVLFLMSAIEKYSSQRPSVTVSVSFADTMVNTEKVMSGYRCDLIIVEDPRALDYIDKNSDNSANPYGLDLIVSDSRTEICTYEDAASGTVLDFSSALLKQTGVPYEAQQFISFLLGCGDDVFADYGFVKAE